MNKRSHPRGVRSAGLLAVMAVLMLALPGPAASQPRDRHWPGGGGHWRGGGGRAFVPGLALGLGALALAP